MAKYTQEQINNIVGLRGHDGIQVDIFKLHGVLFVGNTENGKWDLDKNYLRLSEHNLPLSIDDFELCETEDEVRNTFSEKIKRRYNRQIIIGEDVDDYR